ncbi:MAG TPA: hypothetical protein VIO36_12935 [Anaerolineaceae bacterium]
MKMIKVPVLFIHVEQDFFLFGEKKLYLDTCLQIKKEEDESMTILEYGKRSFYANQNVCVELFRDQGYIHRKVNRFDLLELWFRYGISLSLSESRSILRPLVTFENYKSLRPMLLGYEKIVLEQLALQGGFRKVLFE